MRAGEVSLCSRGADSEVCEPDVAGGYESNGADVHEPDGADVHEPDSADMLEPDGAD